MANWQHSPLSTKAKAPAAAGKPTGFAWEHDQTQHIVYRGVDGKLHELWYQHGVLDNVWKSGGDLTAKAGSDPIGFVWEADNSQHVIYRGTDDQIHELWFKK